MTVLETVTQSTSCDPFPRCRGQNGQAENGEGTVPSLTVRDTVKEEQQ